jgi:hypothetical protein
MPAWKNSKTGCCIMPNLTAIFDAEILKDLIFKKTGREITLNALDRAFGIIPAKFKPSTYTLDTLSIYCGYGNWDDFYMVNREVLSTN